MQKFFEQSTYKMLPGLREIPNLDRRSSCRTIILISVFLALVAGGCSTTRTNQFLEETQRPTSAALFFNQLDKAVESAGVSHQAYARIDNFPYLRTNRYLTALKNRLDSPAHEKAWLLAMQALDLEAREKEIANLPWPAVERLTQHPAAKTADRRQVLLQKTRELSRLMLNLDIQAGTLYPALIETVEVPDSYSLTMRTFGLYPLVMPVVAYFTNGAYDTMRERNRAAADAQITHGEIVAYSPPNKNSRARSDIVKRIYANAPRDLFGLPLLSKNDKQVLAELLSPVFLHDVADSFDIPGEVTWESNQLAIDTEKPSVYYYFSAMLFQGKPILQVNYVTWTSGRLGPNAPSIEKGELDGITLRISLDDTGEPFLVDGMNNCGCYHFFVPRKERLQRVLPIDWEFDAVVVDHLPLDFPQNPIGIRVTSGWHQVEDVGTSLTANRHETYRLLPYELLESIPRSPGDSASMFDEEGVGIGSDRIEIYIFFSMGIPRVGAMRQRGHHPTKLVGRAHFDDPYLLDKNFEFTH